MNDEHANKQQHEHTNQAKPSSTKRSADWWADMWCFACAGLLGVVVFVGVAVGGKYLYERGEDRQTAHDQRIELERCRLEQYVSNATGRVPLETVDLDMKKTGPGVQVTGDGLVLVADADPLDVFVATADECSDILSSQYIDEPDPQRCRIEQYILEHLPSHQQAAVVPVDLKLDTKNNDDATEITINGYVAFTDVDAAVLLSRHEACDPSDAA